MVCVAREILWHAEVMLAARKVRRSHEMPSERADAVASFPDIGVLEHFFDHFAIGRESHHERVRIAGIECPTIAGEKILDGEAIFYWQCVHRTSSRTIARNASRCRAMKSENRSGGRPNNVS